jgi:signal transduction histidine kinase
MSVNSGNALFAGDQPASLNRLSANAKKMLALRDDVLLEWVKRLRSTVKEAEQLPQPILLNTFPVLYDNLAQAISPDHPRTTSTLASEHGGERARLTSYNAQAVVLEYQLLRWTIFDVLTLNGVQFSGDELIVISASIDDAIRESVASFALAQSAMRERFVATLTHDLRNPLAVVNAAAEMIQHKSDSPEIQMLSSRIIDNTSRMDSMIQELLDAVVFQTGERLRLHLQQIDILDVARDVCDEFISIDGPRFPLIGETVMGFWDREAFKRAIENLVSNAIKYGARDSQIQVFVTSFDGRMRLSVHNSGSPIPPEQLESIFLVFRRAKAAKEGDKDGWGIGLPYVRSVAESHGGSVEVDSTVERGTTFTIDVPIDSRPYQNAPTLDS